MELYKLGVYEKSMPDDISFKEKLECARNAGFDFLEISIDESDFRLSRLDWDKQQRMDLLRTTREQELYINTMCLSGHRKYPLGSGIPEIEKRSIEIMQKAIEFAYDIGIHVIQLAGYDVYYDEVSTPTTKERFLQNLIKSTEYAASRGIVLGLETMENDFMNTVEKAMYYVDTVNSPFLKVYPDVGNITNATGHVAKDIRTGKGNIIAAHLKETVPNVFRNMKYGEGDVDFKLCTDVLKSLGVTMFNAEFWYDKTDGWKDYLSEANKYLRKFL